MIDGHFFEEHLIHRTARGEMVRSKSEVIIADHLQTRASGTATNRHSPIDGVTKYPDFTIEDMESGLTFYWEHCGMLHVPELPPPVGREARLVPSPRDPAAGRRERRERHT